MSEVLKNQKGQLITVGALALGYIVISALIVFQVEPQTFDNFFNAIYWATVSLTTVGYGDIYPTTEIGKVISMLSSFFGIAVVALPAGIIVAGYTEVLAERTSKKE
ncbi:MAG: potassium channel family protein [Lachnospiraceae bacterium]